MGTGNVFIGPNAGYNETTSNKLYIDNSNTSTPLIYGDFSTNRLSINAAPSSTHTLSVGGTINSTGLFINGVAIGDATYWAKSGTNLYKRILTAPSTMSICGTPFQKQTCPSGHTSATCPLDKQLTDKLNSFSITYYDTGNNVTTTPENAEKVKVSIQLKDKAFAEDIYANSSITLRKLNQ